MPKLANRLPKLCRHRRGSAFVKIVGNQIWLGVWGEPQTQQNYDRLIATWLANRRQLPDPAPAAPTHLTIDYNLAPHWRWAKSSCCD